MEPFVLTGKAHQVFKWLELAQQHAKECAEIESQLKNESRICWCDYNSKCNVPVSTSCSLIDCPVFIKLFGKKER